VKVLVLEMGWGWGWGWGLWFVRYPGVITLDKVILLVCFCLDLFCLNY